jgi:hypothetical protein
MMGSFEKFNETLYISKGEKFIASLELKLWEEFYFYDVVSWRLIVREKDCVHEKVLGIFVRKEDQLSYIKYDLESTPLPPQMKEVIRESFDGHLWNEMSDITVRSLDLLEALEYN